MTHGRYYAAAQNLVPLLRKTYDDVLEEYDVLVMPTLPITATTLVSDQDDLTTSIIRALDARQHRPDRLHRPPGDQRSGRPGQRPAD
jgi:Asp-tRNA(Asn)/Glu-tRNA(Gln) amidotransferase A subunit family amidase